MFWAWVESGVMSWVGGQCVCLWPSRPPCVKPVWGMVAMWVSVCPSLPAGLRISLTWPDQIHRWFIPVIHGSPSKAFTAAAQSLASDHWWSTWRDWPRKTIQGCDVFFVSFHSPYLSLTQAHILSSGAFQTDKSHVEMCWPTFNVGIVQQLKYSFFFLLFPPFLSSRSVEVIPSWLHLMTETRMLQRDREMRRCFLDIDEKKMELDECTHKTQ